MWIETLQGLSCLPTSCFTLSLLATAPARVSDIQHYALCVQTQLRDVRREFMEIICIKKD